MAEVPGDQIIYLVKRSERNMQRIGDVLAMKDAARDIAFGENRRLIRQLDLFELTCEFQVTCAMRLGHALKLAQDERRDHSAVFRHFVFPPANRQVTTKWLAVIEVGADNRGFK